MGWVHAQDRATGSESEPLKSGLAMDIEKGVCYLVKEKKPEVSYRLFEVLMEQKLPGIIISRQHPKLVRREHGFADVRIVWLSHTPGEDFQSPAALGALAKLIQKFVDDNHGEGVILLDGLEFLIVNNGFLPTLMIIEHINEFIMQRQAMLLLPVSPETLEDKELALLERNVKVLESPALKTDLETREVSRLLDTY